MLKFAFGFVAGVAAAAVVGVVGTFAMNEETFNNAVKFYGK